MALLLRIKTDLIGLLAPVGPPALPCLNLHLQHTIILALPKRKTAPETLSPLIIPTNLEPTSSYPIFFRLLFNVSDVALFNKKIGKGGFLTTPYSLFQTNTTGLPFPPRAVCWARVAVFKSCEVVVMASDDSLPTLKLLLIGPSGAGKSACEFFSIFFF